MRLMHVGKDGGPQSTVTGYWLVEAKKLFSIALLRFDNGSREAFHSHAFDSISWLLTGKLKEEHTSGHREDYRPGPLPIITRRSTFHRVFSEGTSWVLTFRGPWSRAWKEYDPETRTYSRLTDGRVVETTEC